MTTKHSAAQKKTWVVTLDGARARYYQMEKTAERLKLTNVGEMDGSRLLTQEIVADRPGHTHDSRGPARHTMEPRTTAHEHAEEVFAAKVAKKLEHDGAQGLFDELVVVADPRALGHIRKDLDRHFRDRFVALEIGRDWSKMSATEVAQHLQPHLDELKLH
jgi:protein required for attachment to host cells